MKSIRIAHLSLAFLLLAGLLALIFGVLQHMALHGVEHSIETSGLNTARQELKDSLTELNKSLLDSGRNLAEWEETRQQLYNDEFYTFWRDDRVKDAGMLPSYVSAVALYKPSGVILRPRPRNEPMPIQMPLATPPFLYHEEVGQTHYLYHFFPVYADPDQAMLIGYGGIKIDLLAAIATQSHFRFLDLDKLVFKLTSGGRVDLNDALSSAEIALLPNKEIEQLFEAFHVTQLRLLVTMTILLALAVWGINALLVRPLQLLTSELDKLRTNPEVFADAHLGKASYLKEIETLRSSFTEYQRRLGEMHQQLQESSRNFYDQARRDALTAAYNRRAFDEDWTSWASDKRIRNATLILFDCDHFKAINDTYGHPAGDAVIQSIAACLMGALRVNDRLYRLGGDEFATLVTNTEPDIANQVAQRCQEHVLSYDFQALGVQEPVTISIGVARIEGTLDLPTLHKHADLAMYEAKRPGNQKIIVYDASIGHLAPIVENREVTAVFMSLQHPDLLEFRYQPIIRVPGDALDYVEALVRIRLDGEVIGAGAILSIIQQRRLEVEFDLSVIRAVQHDIRGNHPALTRGVSINISAAGLISDKVLSALLAMRSSVPDLKLVLEITETALISHMDLATQHLNRLREAGWRIALDDFGSGYSSLRYLASMPVDMVKFDMSLIRLLSQPDPRQFTLVKDIIELVSAAGYELVAEGIESSTLLTQVADLGFSHAQGFYIDRHLGGVLKLPEAQTAPGLQA